MKKILIIFSFFLLTNVGCTFSDPEMMELLMEIKAQNETLLEDVEEMRAQLDGLDGQYQVILASLEDNKKELEALKNQVDALKLQLTQQLDKINQVSTQLEVQGADVKKLSAEIAALKASCEELKSLMEQLLVAQTSPKIGDEYAGGIVFYLDPNQSKGMVVSKINLRNGGTEWGCYCQDIKNTKSEVGSGANNTKEMLSQCLSAQSIGNWSAKIVDEYVLGEYNDWYLPSKDELNLIYINLHQKGLGNFSTTTTYWSSTQASYGSCGISGGGWSQNFANGQQTQEYKSGHAGIGAVRAIRSF